MRLKQSYKKLFISGFILSLTFFGLSAVAAESPAGNGSKAELLSPGVAAPVCKLKGIDNLDYTFPESGHWNMVFFWSLFCHSCLEEMPAVQTQLANKNQRELKAYFVSLDSEKMQKALVNFCKKRDLKQPVLMEQLASASYLTADQWGVSTTPSVFIVAPDGKIAYSHQGPMDIDKFFADFEIMSATGSEIIPAEK